MLRFIPYFLNIKDYEEEALKKPDKPGKPMIGGRVCDMNAECVAFNGIF